MRCILILFLLIASSFSHNLPQAYAQHNALEEQKVPLPQGSYEELRLMNVYTIGEILDPLRIRLDNDDIIELSSLEIPDLTPYDAGDVAVAAKDFLSTLLPKDTKIRLYQTKDNEKGRQNRMGYRLAHIEKVDGDIWIQGALLANGLARVRPTKLNTEMSTQMLALENQARLEARGLWSLEGYEVLTPETALEAPHGWVIAEGKVVSNAIANNVVYLNFGNNWRDDFTVAIKPDVRRKFVKDNIDTLQFAGKRVRVHGWLESYNGPYIELFDPAWLEVLPDPSESTTLSSDE